MADGYIIVTDAAGIARKMQVYRNTVSGESVDSEAVTLTNTDGTAVPIIDSKPRVSTMPYLYDIAEGNVAGHTPFSKLGYNIDVNNVEEDVWTQGGKYVFPAAAMGMEVYAANAQDDASGTGVQKVKVYYLDENYASQVEEVTLEGEAAVAMVADNILRVNAIRASQVGTGKVAAGLITVRNLADTPVYRAIEAGYTRGRSLIHTVPAGKTLYIVGVNISCSSSSGGHYARYTLRTNYDELADSMDSWLTPHFEMSVQDTAVSISLPLPLKVPEMSDLVMSVVSDNVAANVLATAALRGWTE